MIRQKSGSKKTQMITFRVENIVFEILEALGKQKNQSPHELARDIIIAYLRAKGYLA
jgi:hypothetical protein